MITTIIFDIGNVLTDFTWREQIESKGFHGDMLERIADATVRSEQWKENDLGILSDEEIMEYFVRNDPGIEQEIRKAFEDKKKIVARRDYVIPWIQDLKRNKYRVLYLSNFSHRASVECADALDFIPYTDGGILSYREHIVKPMPEIYKLLIDRYELIPEECVFLDDVEENLRAAEAFGIHTILFENQEQAKSELAKLGVNV